jgi:hypothetical protein
MFVRADSMNCRSVAEHVCTTFGRARPAVASISEIPPNASRAAAIKPKRRTATILGSRSRKVVPPFEPRGGRNTLGRILGAAGLFLVLAVGIRPVRRRLAGRNAEP